MHLILHYISYLSFPMDPSQQGGHVVLLEPVPLPFYYSVDGGQNQAIMAENAVCALQQHLAPVS